MKPTVLNITEQYALGSTSNIQYVTLLDLLHLSDSIPWVFTAFNPYSKSRVSCQPPLIQDCFLNMCDACQPPLGINCVLYSVIPVNPPLIKDSTSLWVTPALQYIPCSILPAFSLHILYGLCLPLTPYSRLMHLYG